MMITADCLATGDELLRPGWIETADDLVVALGSGPPAQPVDLALGDVTVVPGFVDTHVHGGGGGAFPDATEEASRAAIELHRRHGTTTMIASLVSAQPGELLRQVGVLSEQVQDGTLAGIHLEGPWLSHRRCGAHHPSALRDPDPAELEKLLATGDGTIRMITLAPELDGALRAIRHIADEGIVAAVGHTDSSFEIARDAIEAGATVGTHAFNAMAPVHHRDPGPFVALALDPRVTLEVIADGIHVHPALYQLVCSRASERISLVTDAMAAAGMPDGGYELGKQAVQVIEGVARLAGSDTIAGSTATMDRLFRFALQHGVDDPDDALRAAVRQTSITPARALGLATAGLSPGSAANLVVLDPDFEVTAVMYQGGWN